MSRRRLSLLGLVAVDAPVAVAVLALGWLYGYAHVYTAVMDWRLAHPWSMIPSVAMVVMLAIQWRRRT